MAKDRRQTPLARTNLSAISTRRLPSEIPMIWRKQLLNQLRDLKQLHPRFSGNSHTLKQASQVGQELLGVSDELFLGRLLILLLLNLGFDSRDEIKGLEVMVFETRSLFHTVVFLRADALVRQHLQLKDWYSVRGRCDDQLGAEVP